MATRSTIAIELKDGSVKQVYCHWDGYLDHVGKILLQHYSDPEKLERLIDHGSISSLEKEIGEKHPFGSLCEDETTFYARDRGEPLVVKKYWNLAMYEVSASFEEYNYILRKDGILYYMVDGGSWAPVPLSLKG